MPRVVQYYKHKNILFSSKSNRRLPNQNPINTTSFIYEKVKKPAAISKKTGVPRAVRNRKDGEAKEAKEALKMPRVVQYYKHKNILFSSKSNRRLLNQNPVNTKFYTYEKVKKPAAISKKTGVSRAVRTPDERKRDNRLVQRAKQVLEEHGAKKNPSNVSHLYKGEVAAGWREANTVYDTWHHRAPFDLKASRKPKNIA